MPPKPIEVPDGVERLLLIRSPGRGWELADNPHVGAVPGIETKEVVAVAALPSLEDSFKERVRKALEDEGFHRGCRFPRIEALLDPEERADD